MVAMRGEGSATKVKTALSGQLRLSKHRLVFKPCHGYPLAQVVLQRPPITILLAYSRTPRRITPGLSSRLQDLGWILLIVLPSDVESLKNGIIKTSKNEAKAPYNILLLGETGVGKSTFLELIASVLAGKHINPYNLDDLDHTNDLTTNSVHLYELTSKNGIVVSASICEHVDWA